MSELSTVAIKDGHRGHLPHHHNPMDAERADRISRLAGLERVAAPGTTAPRNPSNLAPAGYGQQQQFGAAPTPAYFDQNNTPQIMRERSTVGSASATGSVGGRTTWASGSDVYDPDKMSEDQDIPVSVAQDGDGDAQMEAETTSSVGGFSDENSLVGFGEGARTPARTHSTTGGMPGSPIAGKVTPTGVPSHMRTDQFSNPSSASMSSMGGQDARMIDGMTYDSGVVDTVNRTPPPTGVSDAASGRSPSGAEQAERIMGERFEGEHGGLQSDGGAGLGKFGFEGRRD